MNTERISFDIISNAGQARDLIYDALEFIRDKKYRNAESKIKDAEGLILKAHESHIYLVSEEAKGNKVPIDLLLSHAMDILITAESEKDMTQKIMEIDIARTGKDKI